MRSSKTFPDYLIVLSILIILFCSSVAAYQEDFEAFGAKKDITVCSCDLNTDSITLQNTGDVTSVYSLYNTGEVSNWVNMAPQVVSLEPGEIKQVDRFIKVPCKKTGEYEFNTTIKTLFETEKVLEQKLTIQNCENVMINPHFTDKLSGCPCTPMQYSFDVINTGNHIETYELSVEPYSDGISMSADLIVLEPGEKQTIDVFINLECSQYGLKDFTFNAFARGTGILGQTDFSLDIQKCYDFDILAADDYIVCQGVPNIIPIQIENKASVANDFVIDAQANKGSNDWIQVENPTLSAWSGETINSSILVTPPVETEGTYSLILNALATRGEESRTKNIGIETEKCYDYELTEGQYALDSIACEEKNHEFTLMNIGSRETTYTIDLERNDWLTTQNNQVKLGAGEQTTIIIKGNSPCETGDYLENIYVTIDDINQTYLEEKTFSVKSKEDAYLLDISNPDLTVGYEGGEKDIQITNKGFEKASYSIITTASDWITIDKSEFELGPGENTTLTLMAYPTEDVSKDVYAGEITASVKGQGIEYSTDFLVTVGQKTNWMLMSIVSGGVVLLILVLLLLLFLRKKKTKEEDKTVEDKPKKAPITVDKREYRRAQKEKKKSRFWPILIAIILLLAIAGGAYFIVTSGAFAPGSEETNTTETQPAETPTQEITQESPAETAPETVDILTNEDIQEELITIDRTAVAGEGNTLELTNETEITLPISIKNPTDRKARFSINAQEGVWVTFDKDKVTVMPNSTEIVNLKITPNLQELDTSDYAISMNTSLVGTKIQYEEELSLVLTKQKSQLKDYIQWIIGGVIALIIIIIILALIGRSKENTTEEKAKIKPVKEKKAKIKARAEKKEEKGGILPLVIALIVVLIIASLGIWAYKTFYTGTSEQTTPEETEQTPEITTQNESVTEEKVTENNTEESLITIDRSDVPGDGNIMSVNKDSYVLPLYIRNPTDRKARFTVNTSDGSWMTFDEYRILINPLSTRTLNMTLTPNLEELKENDYSVSLNTKLEGQKINYQEQLNFVIKQKNKFDMSYAGYGVLGLILIIIIIIISETIRRKNKTPTRKKYNVKEKNINDINKEIFKLRKNTSLKLKRNSY